MVTEDLWDEGSRRACEGDGHAERSSKNDNRSAKALKSASLACPQSRKKPGGCEYGAEGRN